MIGHNLLNLAGGTPETTSNWRDITTAPRDGTAILLFSPQHGTVEGCWEQVDGGGHPENGPPIYWWTSPHVEFLDGPYDAPTHWMPFKPPTSDVKAPQLEPSARTPAVERMKHAILGRCIGEWYCKICGRVMR